MKHPLNSMPMLNPSCRKCEMVAKWWAALVKELIEMRLVEDKEVGCFITELLGDP